MDSVSQSLEFTYLINKNMLSSNWAGSCTEHEDMACFPMGLVVWRMVMGFGFDLILVLT